MYKLLVVDDEKLIRQGLVDYVDWSRHGITVAGTAADGTTALELAVKNPPDIILSDIKMATMDGIELLKALRAHGIRSEIIFISAYSRFEDAQEALRYGAFDYILKPIEEAKLLQVVGRCVQKLEERSARLASDGGGRPVLCDEASNIVLCVIDEEHGDSLGSRIRTHLSRQNGCQVETKVWDRTHAASYLVASSIACPADALRDLVMSAARHVASTPSGQEPPRERVGLSGAYGPSSGHPDRMRAEAEVALLCPIEVGEPGIRDYMGVSQQLPAHDEHYDEIGVLTAGLVDDDTSLVDEALAAVWRGMIDEGLTTNRDVARSRMRDLLDGVCERLAGANQFFSRPPDMDTDSLREAYDDAGGLLEIGELTQRSISRLRAYLDDSPVRRASKLVTSAMSYIETHISRTLSLQEVADQLAITPGYLSRIFGEESGQSFSRYVLACRIAAAKEQLADPRLRIQDIARNSGYSDLAHFSRVFKAETGLTPSQYRKVSGHVNLS